MSQQKKEEQKVKTPNETANINEMRTIFATLKLDKESHILIEQVLQHFENKE